MNDDQSADELRLRATEAQMRRALGLTDRSPQRAQPAPPASQMPSAATHRRHFVRDGEVPVTVVHNDDGAGTNKLDAARQAVRVQIVAREQVERLLEEARSAIQTLETQLAHERIAKEEAIRRISDQRQQAEQQLEEERSARQQAEQERNDAVARCQLAEERLRLLDVDIVAKARAPRNARRAGTAEPGVGDSADEAQPGLAEGVPATDTAQARRRGSAAKLREPRSEFVEWWKPGWKNRLR